MTLPEIRYVVPPPTQALFAPFQMTHHFYQEATYRGHQEEYCHWYRAVADAHRRELEVLRTDVNILSWFRRDRP